MPINPRVFTLGSPLCYHTLIFDLMSSRNLYLYKAYMYTYILFGASQVQTTLHTEVLYLINKEPIPFCIVSPTLQHGPRAIWAYIEPVLKFLQDGHSQITFFISSVTDQLLSINRNAISACFPEGYF